MRHKCIICHKVCIFKCYFEIVKHVINEIVKEKSWNDYLIRNKCKKNIGILNLNTTATSDN